MRHKHIALSLVALATYMGLVAWKAPVGSAQEAPDTAEVVVHMDQPTLPVSPSLYGVFFEEINHAGDGGLYAELVRNRSFEDGRTPEGWIASGAAQIALDNEKPLNSAQTNSLRVTTTGGTANVANEGYWGVPIRKGAAYRLSVWIHGSVSAPLTASLQGADGRSYATAALGKPAAEWTNLKATLRANDADPAGRLVISTTGSGVFWLDVVSLFPVDTWKGRANGLRKDLAEKVHAMRPAFFRFPGGCFVEGDRIRNAFRWKETLGPIHERKGHLNDIWGYRSTDGLGYHEYLQMCEDLGAEAMFVVNCGMAHRDVIPMDQLEPWVQDALDAIEYAVGPTTSKWGALRAKNGHPKPFKLRYVEIGNENGWGNTLPQYEERYARFHDAIKAKYPRIELIANTPIRSRPMEILDDHFYNSPQWFWNNVGLYDRRDRSGPKIYVGEYAVTQNAGTGNLAAALAEAAFMTGLERNADVVVMASYAPLFVNVKDRRWNPDTIAFDTVRSYGTPSYYVQKLFADNRPDFVYKTETNLTSRPRELVERGGVGLSTWNTQAEFKDVEVLQNGKTVYASKLTEPAPEWRRRGGQWSFQEGVLRQMGGGTDGRMMLELPALTSATDYTLRLKARKISGDEGFLVMFRSRSQGDFYWWNLGGWGNTLHAIEKGIGGAKSDVGSRVPGRIETGRWYDIRIELAGPRIRCYLDDRLIHDVADRAAQDIATTAGWDEKTGEIVVKVVNGAGSDRKVTLRLNGVGSLRPTGRGFRIQSASLDDENSLDAPEKITIRPVKVEGVSDTFTHTFPSHSVTVLRLKRQ